MNDAVCDTSSPAPAGEQSAHTEERGLPVIRTDSPDNVWEPMDTSGLPDGEFLAVAAVPCPAGRVARGGAGGQAFTACAFCGHPSASTAMERHEGPMLVPVIARKEVDIVTFRRAVEADFSGGVVMSRG